MHTTCLEPDSVAGPLFPGVKVSNCDPQRVDSDSAMVVKDSAAR